MKILRKSFLTVVSIILCLTVLSQTATASFLSPKTLYVEDLKIIYADSEEEAKEQLPDGYQLVPGNINAETGELGVYICYSTTENRDDAITDIKVMHESGGFQRTDFKSSLDQAIDGVYGLAKEMMTAVNEFAENYNAGLPAAVYAKEALNYFEYDETTLLGDFMLSGTGTYKDYGKMILMCHEEILNPILSLLALGVQKKAGENWMDKLANVDPASYSSAQDGKFRERATKLRPVLQEFNDMYCYIMGYYGETYTYEDLTSENDKALFTQMAENKELFTVIQSLLQSYPVGTNVGSEWTEWGGTAEDIFAIGLNSTLNLYETYALLDCLTPGQEVMLRMTGPYNFIIGSQNTEEVAEEAKNRLLENLDTTEKIPIWEGVNLDIFDKEVALTSDAQRSIAAGKQYDIFAKDVDTLAQKYRDTASIISSCFTIASCSVLVAKCSLILAPKFFNLISCYSIASAISAFASSAIVTTIFTVLGITFTVAAIVCSLFVSFFLEDIIAWMLKEDYERTSIPDYMVNEVVGRYGISTYAYYQRVDNVRTDKDLGLDTDDNESGSDINANKGYRWMALYTTNKSSVGNPIKADFLIVSGTGLDQEGYVPLSMFGNINAVNLNSYADETSSKYPAIYLHYVQDKITPVESEQVYIKEIRAESGKHEDEAKTKLTNAGFIPINHDFGCKQGESTFIGYKLTPYKGDAVKDIRLLYNCNGSSVDFGDLSYGAMGTIGNFSLMVSSGDKNPAPPIVEIKLYERDELPEDNLGYEPVNEFSGGMAHPLGRSKTRLYFLPETTFTTGPDYLAGIKTDVYYYNTYSIRTKYTYPYRYYAHEDTFGNNVENYRAYKAQNYREQFFNFNSVATYYFQAYSNADSRNTVNLGYKYTTTKNPYRAIYGVMANKRNGLDSFSSSVMYAQEGYVLAAAEFSSASRIYTSRSFVYSPEVNESEFGNYSSIANLDAGTSLRHYTSTYSSGKADAWTNGVTFDANATVHSYDYVYNQDITQNFYCDDMNALYLSGYQADRTPLTVNDIIISDKPLEESAVPSNFTPVTSMIGDSAEPTNVSPSNGEAFAGTYSGNRKIYVTLYNKVYMYFRNEKTVNKKTVAQSNPKEGKYISALYLASKEEIREDYVKTSKDGKQIKCSNISNATVENALFAQGATTTYGLNISTDFDVDDNSPDDNRVLVGIQRTDNANNALTDIRFYFAEKGEYPEKEIKRTITYNGETFPVTYTLVSRASLIELGNQSDADCAKTRQVYIYVSSNPALGEPITEIKISDIFSYHDFEPVLTMDDKHFMVAYEDLIYKKGTSAAISGYYGYSFFGNHLSFKREGGDKPYIQDIMLAEQANDFEEATDLVKCVTKLLRAGYFDVIPKNMNDHTTKSGNKIFIGMKRTADKNDAVYDVKATDNQGKKPKETWDNFTLIANIDLNANTWFGPYIHLYQSKTKLLSQTPLTDLKAVDEKYQTVNINLTDSDSPYIRPGDIVYSEAYVLNQDLKNQDFNDGAGGDWIFLIKCTESKYEMALAYLGSMLGTGSVAVIGLFLAAAAGAIIYVKLKKKRVAVTVGEATDEETGEI